MESPGRLIPFLAASRWTAETPPARCRARTSHFAVQDQLTPLLEEASPVTRRRFRCKTPDPEYQSRRKSEALSVVSSRSGPAELSAVASSPTLLKRKRHGSGGKETCAPDAVDAVRAVPPQKRRGVKRPRVSMPSRQQSHENDIIGPLQLPPPTGWEKRFDDLREAHVSQPPLLVIDSALGWQVLDEMVPRPGLRYYRRRRSLPCLKSATAPQRAEVASSPASRPEQQKAKPRKRATKVSSFGHQEAGQASHSELNGDEAAPAKTESAATVVEEAVAATVTIEPDLRARSLAAALRRSAEEDASPEAQRQRQSRIAAADRGKLEELQGRVIGRLKALKRDVPLTLQKWSYEQLQAFYRQQLPRAFRRDDED
eukprot:TRINITY_DN10844_c0_g1_i2.p1 TRINITY_DN10844_c0_g1~~TRINITY_DN10844_c0_g1_i2.p1  ORF type:complete len:371 (-),score=77.24 TRINITY_DN10844_c0_g1_i2:107-1219(-)